MQNECHHDAYFPLLAPLSECREKRHCSIRSRPPKKRGNWPTGTSGAAVFQRAVVRLGPMSPEALLPLCGLARPRDNSTKAGGYVLPALAGTPWGGATFEWFVPARQNSCLALSIITRSGVRIPGRAGPPASVREGSRIPTMRRQSSSWAGLPMMNHGSRHRRDATPSPPGFSRRPSR